MTSDSDLHNIDTVLSEWRQGDCVVGEQWFLHRFSPEHPLTELAAEIASEGTDIAETQEIGLVVLSQTCEIVRECRKRPFVEVAPLIQVDDQQLKVIQRGHMPRFGFVPGVAKDNLVADLDRVMTVEKAIVAGWSRVRGCDSEAAVDSFAASLARKRARYAFPDDFSMLVDKLQDRLSEKHDRISEEGEALRSLREIRVASTPNWNAEHVDLMFFFIRKDGEPLFGGREWHEILAKWIKLVPPAGRYDHVDGVVVTLDGLSALEYVASAPLDLDHVTTRSP